MKRLLFAALIFLAARAEAVDVIGDWTFKKVEVSTVTASSATFTNITINGACTGSGCATGSLATTDIDTSAEIAAIVGDETGSGALCFANTPTMVTPVLGAATGTSLALGTNPGSAGALRIPNNTAITFRNAANSADYSIKLNASNEFELDAPVNITATASAMLMTGVASPSAPSGAEQWYFYADSDDNLPKYIYNGGSEATFYTTANAQTTISGNAGTATALAANPTDCSANQFANAIAASGNLTCAAIAAADLPAASDTAVGGVELATAAETTTGTDTGRAVTPDGLAGSDFGKDVYVVEVIADATAVTTGDGKAYIPVPVKHNGWLIVGVSGHTGAANSSSGAVDVDIANCAAVATGIRCSGTVSDVLSTNLTIDASEDGSETAAAAAAINTSNDDLATGGWLRIDVDGAGTGTQGLYVTITVQKP